MLNPFPRQPTKVCATSKVSTALSQNHSKLLYPAMPFTHTTCKRRKSMQKVSTTGTVRNHRLIEMQAPVWLFLRSPSRVTSHYKPACSPTVEARKEESNKSFNKSEEISFCWYFGLFSFVFKLLPFFIFLQIMPIPEQFIQESTLFYHHISK